MPDLHLQTDRLIRIGVLVPFTNTNLEPDMMRMCPPNASVHYTRIGGYVLNEIPALGQMQEMGAADISEALNLIAGVKPDVVLYGCTSATLTHGLDFDRNLVGRIEAVTGAKAITAAGAILLALRELGVSKVGFASPYVGEVNAQAIRFLAQAGVEAVKCADVGKTLSNHEQGALTPGDVFGLAMSADHEEAEVIVLACTDLRAIEVIERIETELCKPVVTVNQAMMFATMKEFSLNCAAPAFGCLFDRLQQETQTI